MDLCPGAAAPRACPEGPELPAGDEAPEDGGGVWLAPAAAAAEGLDGDARDAGEAAGELLVEAAPADVEVRAGGPAAAARGRVGGGPVGDAGAGAVGHEGGVVVDVGDEGVEGVPGVGEDAGRGEGLREVGAWEGDERAGEARGGGVPAEGGGAQRQEAEPGGG